MNADYLQLKRVLRAALMVLLLSVAGTPKTMAQTITHVGNGVVSLSLNDIQSYEERMSSLYSIWTDNRFWVNTDENDGVFLVGPTELLRRDEFESTLTEVISRSNHELLSLSKEDMGEALERMKQQLPDDFLTSLMMDYYERSMSSGNNLCINAERICFQDGLFTFPAGVNSGSGESGPNYGCLSIRPNPAWFYVEMEQPGDIDIYMYTEPSRDIDYCCWGPFVDLSVCPSGLTSSKIVSCSYSTSATEHCIIPSSAQVGEYYIIVITNYSNISCNINFSKVAGSGNSDCVGTGYYVTSNSPVCYGQSLQLYSRTVQGASYQWIGPDGWTSTLQNPVRYNFTTEQAGTYYCSITNAEGTTTLFCEVECTPSVVADFIYTSVCFGDTTEFVCTATTNPSGYGITAIQWNLGDGTTATGYNVRHKYETAGNKTVSVTVQSEEACSGTKTYSVPVYYVPNANAGSDQYTRVGEAVTLTGTGGTGDFIYHWTPEELVLNPNQALTTTVPLYVTQDFVLTVTSNGGDCAISTDTVRIIVDPNAMTGSVYADEEEICYGSSTQLHAIASGGTGNYYYSWTPSNGLSASNIPDPIVNTLVSSTYTCHFSDGQTTLDLPVTISVHPTYFNLSNITICEGEEYVWQGQSYSQQGVYTQHLTSIHGCDSIIGINLTVNPTYNETLDVEACEYYIWNNTLFGPGMYQYQYTFESVNGCDSIVTLNMTIYSDNCTHWTAVDGYANTMEIHAVAIVNGEEQRSDQLEIGAFCINSVTGEMECRGVALFEYQQETDRYVADLVIHGDSDEIISYKLFDHESIYEDLSLISDNTVFTSDAVLGSTTSPYGIAFAYPPCVVTAVANPSIGGVVAFDELNRNNEYVRISDISQLVDGQKVIIAARYDENEQNYYAFTNTLTNETSGKLSTVGFTSHSLGSYEIIPENIKALEEEYYWTVGISMDGYTFTNANGDMIGYQSSTNFIMNNEYTSWNIEPGTSEMSTMVPNYSGFIITNTNNTNRGFALNTSLVCGAYAIANLTNSSYNFFLDLFVKSDNNSFSYYSYGSTATLRANANPGYEFVNWTENDEVVSTDSVYSFVVTSDRNLVANFEEGDGCHITFDLYDSYSDGYTGNYLVVSYGNVTEQLTVPNGSFASHTLFIPNGSHVALSWITGTYPGDCSFIVSYSNGNEIYRGSNLNSGFSYEFDVDCEGMPASVFIVTTSANPAEGGTVTGSGTYNQGTSITVYATCNEGYNFANWAENGEVVSTDSVYSFVVTSDRNLVANFSEVTGDYHWDVNINAYPNTMSVVGVVVIDGEEQFRTDLEVGVFCGDECRGRERLSDEWYDPATTPHYYLFLTVYGEDDDALTFRIYDHSLDQELGLRCLNTETFATNGTLGDPDEPYAIEFSNTIIQTADFGQGWNWWSGYVVADDLMAQMKAGLGNNGKQIKSQSKFTMHYSNGWMGQLNSLENDQTYMIQANNACTVELNGAPVNPADYPITLTTGWKWIGYPCTESMSVSEALAGITPSAGDQIKAQGNFATYYNNIGWMGSLRTLTPGAGYMYKLNGTSQTLVFPNGGRGELAENVTAEGNHWTPEVHAYPSNMTVMAVVELEGTELRSESYELAAFANGEVRGSAKLMYVEPLDRYMAFLTIAGDEAAELSFGLYDGLDEYLDSDDFIVYATDAVGGTPDAPMVVRFRGTTGLSENENSLFVYPNPANDKLNIKATAGGRIEVFSVIGELVYSKDGCAAHTELSVRDLPAGTYVIRMISDDSVQIARFVKE